MNLGTCNELFLPLLTLILSVIHVNSFEVNIGDSGQVKVQQGSSVTLKCQGSESCQANRFKSAVRYRPNGANRSEKIYPGSRDGRLSESTQAGGSVALFL